MAFVRKKRSRGSAYYQVVESYLADGKPRQRVLVHLGRYSSVDGALKSWPKDIEVLKKRLEEAQKKNPAPALPGMGGRRDEEPEKTERRIDVLKGKLEKLKELRRQGEV